MHTNSHRGAGRVQLQAKLAIRPNAAGHHQSRQAGLLERSQRFPKQHFNDCSFSRGRQIGQHLHWPGFHGFSAIGGNFFGLHHDSRFQAGKREVQVAAVHQGPGQFVSLGVTLFSHARQSWPARVTQAQQLGGLVKRFACGIVNGLAQQLVPPYPIHAHQLGVSSTHQQGYKGEFGRVGTQERRQQMPLQMVHAQHRFAKRSAQGTGHPGTHQ